MSDGYTEMEKKIPNFQAALGRTEQKAGPRFSKTPYQDIAFQGSWARILMYTFYLSDMSCKDQIETAGRQHVSYRIGAPNI